MKARLNLKQVRNAILLLAFLLLAAVLGYWWGTREVKVAGGIKPRIEVVNRVQPERYRQIDFSLFWEVWQRLEQAYLDPERLDGEEMVYGAIAGMVSALDDPYTVFLDPSQNQQTKEDLDGSFFGVGIQLGYKEGQLAVIAPLAGMPAEHQGVKAGDLILHIRDEGKGVDTDTIGMSLPEAVSLIRGKKDTEVTLTLLHQGEVEPEEITIVRGEIVVPSVELNWLTALESERKIVHLKLGRFSERLDMEWDGVVEEVLAGGEEIGGVILDLRNNPGGYLLRSVDIAGEFISSGVVVRQQGRGEGRDYRVSGQGRLIGLPVVVLVNEGTASSAEIVAGALRDRLGVRLVGEQTFGKGTIQDAEDLRGGAGLHVTTARWLLPSGDWIHEEGLEPDIEIVLVDDEEGVDEQLQKALEVL